MFGLLTFATVPFAGVINQDLSGNPWVIICPMQVEWTTVSKDIKSIRSCKDAS